MEELLEHRLRKLQLRCKRPVDHLLAGEYRSVFKGRGIEFDDVREYILGDDVRAIDWKVTARTGTPYIKRFIEEREQAFILVLDISASGHFGGEDQNKIEAARELCALMAWSAARSKDRVGLVLFSDDVDHYVPPGRGRNHVMRIVSDMMEAEPKGRGTNLRRALEFVGEVTRKRGVVFVVSDFLAEGYDEVLQVLAQRHDLTAVCVRDAIEQELPEVGIVNCRDLESGATQWVDVSNAALCERYASASVQRLNALQETCAEAGAGWLQLAPGDDCVSTLVGYFQNRHRRVADETGG